MRLLAAILCALALIAPTAHAERFSLEFRGAAFGVLPLGETHLDIDVRDDAYTILARMRSAGLLALFERTRLTAQAEGLIGPEGVAWRRYELDHHYSRKHRAVLMRRLDAGIEATITPNYVVWGEPPANEAQRLASRDPLSSLVAMGVDVARTRACAGDYLTFDGRFHYRLEVRGGEVRRVDDLGYDGPALRCRLRYVPVAGFEPNDNGRRVRIPEGEIWFALIEGSNFAPPVRASAPLPIGRAGLQLIRMTRPDVRLEDGA